MKVYVWSKTGKLIMKEEDALGFNFDLKMIEGSSGIKGSIKNSEGIYSILMTEGVVTTFEKNDETNKTSGKIIGKKVDVKLKGET